MKFEAEKRLSDIHRMWA